MSEDEQQQSELDSANHESSVGLHKANTRLSFKAFGRLAASCCMLILGLHALTDITCCHGFPNRHLCGGADCNLRTDQQSIRSKGQIYLAHSP
jgi:hypothetical protein